MQNFQDTLETRKGSFISAFLICMTVPLSVWVVLSMYSIKVQKELI